MSLNEFKVIFYWEYFHRIIARFIGLFFLIPLIYFYFCKKIKKEYIKICFLIFFLITIQGVIGWIMVKSGLTDDITVSHYRLSIHLVLAILIISIIFWLLMNIKNNKNKSFFKFDIRNIFFQIFILLIFFQIIMGAFVSGLDAGRIYQTWPLMGNNYFPNDITFKNFSTLYEFNNHSLVQFYHRNLAYLIVLYSITLVVIVCKNKLLELYNPLKLLLLLIFTQVILGILTLVSGLNIYLASLHQISSVLLVFSALYLYYFRAK
jgi:cytochrome c oxidase assembly protein subunit 15